VTRLAQPWRQFPPNHTAGPAAMHQDERRHSFLPHNAACRRVVFSVRRDSIMIAALACWNKIGANGGNRRVSPVAPGPREGPLTRPTAGAQPRPQECVLCPKRPFATIGPVKRHGDHGPFEAEQEKVHSMIFI
jgi:hypothetical protein